MKRILTIASIIAVLAMLATIGIQRAKIKRVMAQKDAWQTTAESQLRDIERYDTKLGLEAVKTQEMRLTLEQYEKYRAEDAKTIASLRANKKELERVINTQTTTIVEIKSKLRDSVIVNTITNMIDTLRCIEYHDVWIDFAGCIDSDDEFNGYIESRDTLLIIEHAIRKRFLGFLWKTKRIKHREMDVVAKNPHTKILGTELITIWE